MGLPKGQREYFLLSDTLDQFNYTLARLVNEGWKPMPGTPCTISRRRNESSTLYFAHQMLIRYYNIDKEAI